jgi:halimadienyl-diphosphate synthase
MTALAQWGQKGDGPRLQRAQSALQADLQNLDADPAGETVGFEMIVPTLLDEAQALGVWSGRNDGQLDRLRRKRAAKLAALPSGMIDRSVTVAFSAEMAGSDGTHLLEVENLTEANGSVGLSPSATAYYLLNLRPHDRAARAYLHTAADSSDGGVQNFAPFDTFERAWVLWNLALAGPLDDQTLALCQPHLDHLESAWKPQQGVGFAAGYTPKDGDCTSVAYEVLNHFDRSPDLETVLLYEEQDHFRCYALEANPSVSGNIHILGALRQAGLGVTHPSVSKALRFLQRTRSARGPWFDKWHISTYYATAHAIIACADYTDDLVHDAVSWMLKTQNADGSWGTYLPTAEETAYCLQALVVWKRHGGQVPCGVLRRGAAWLADHAEPPYLPLWIAKTLYTPELVVRSAVLSALRLAAQE